MLADRRLKMREIYETVGISKNCVANILHYMSARWVPRLLTPDNKRNREIISEQCLTLFKSNPKEFMSRFVTVDEAWIHWYTPETKEQSKRWTSPDERVSRTLLHIIKKYTFLNVDTYKCSYNLTHPCFI